MLLSEKADIFAEIFANATVDINANICRLVIDIVSMLYGNETFDKTYISRILAFINNSFSDLDKIIYRDKKYTVNKILFKLSIPIFVLYNGASTCILFLSNPPTT